MKIVEFVCECEVGKYLVKGYVYIPHTFDDACFLYGTASYFFQKGAFSDEKHTDYVWVSICGKVHPVLVLPGDSHDRKVSKFLKSLGFRKTQFLQPTYNFREVLR